MKRVLWVVASLLAVVVIVFVVNYLVFDYYSTVVTTGKPIDRRAQGRQALVIIDIQEGLTGSIAPEEYYRERAPEVIDVVNALIDSAAARKMPVIYVKNEISNPLLNSLNDMYEKGKPGAELDARLHRVSSYIVTKDRGDAFSNPLLDTILTEHHVTSLVVTGLELGRCVKNTIEGARNRGYDICLIRDAVIAQPDSIKETLLDSFKSDGCDVLFGAEYLARAQK